MEVHHHPKVEKRRFKEYFLEFLMIFLAVTMGFIAENVREHYTEKANTKQYPEPYRDEQLQQQVVFDQYIKEFQQKMKRWLILSGCLFRRLSCQMCLSGLPRMTRW